MSSRTAIACLLALLSLSSFAAGADVAAYRTLAMEKDPASAPRLIAGLADADPIIRRLSIYGLERIGDSSAAVKIVPLLNDADPWVQRTAATALGKLGGEGSAAALTAVLADEDVKVRMDVLLALGRLGDPASQKAILSALRDLRLWSELDPWDQVSLVHIVERDWFTDPGAKDLLKWLLTYGSWDWPAAGATPAKPRRSTLLIANRAADVLAVKYGDDSGLEFLLKGLTADAHMQQRSALAVEKLKAPRAVAPLGKMLAGRWLLNKHYALRALGEIGTAEAVEAIRPYLTHKDIRTRRIAASAFEKATGEPSGADLAEPPTAQIPDLDQADLQTPGGKRPPQFIALGIDDCVNIEGLEAMLDIVETFAEQDRKVVFTLFVAPRMANVDTRDMLKQSLLHQRLFDLGCEIANHTLHHNPGGRNWVALPREQQVEEIEGCTQWFQENIDGFTRPFTLKSGGGGHGAQVDPEFTAELIARQNYIYRGRRNQHPNDQTWPQAGQGYTEIQTGMLDAAAPPVHATITDGIPSDYPGRFDYDIDSGVAMWTANFDYHYRHPRRPILAINAFHAWAFKSVNDSSCQVTHRNEGPILKQFLHDVLVRDRAKYPDTHVVTFRQVLEYVQTGGDLKATLELGNGQDSRKMK